MADTEIHRIHFDMLFPPEMAQRAAEAGVKKVQIDVLSLTLLGILAGMFIGFGSDLYTVTLTGMEGVPFGLQRLLGGFVFCIGLVLVVIAGAELFTGNNLIVMAVLSRRVAFRWLLRNWVIVYIGNFIGSLLLAAMVWAAGQHHLAGGDVGRLAMRVAQAKCTIPFWPAFFRGVLCNALVCWAVWMCFSSRLVTDRFLAVLFPITAFVTCGFEHCVANMYFISAGLFIQAETGAPLAGLTWWNFLVTNLIPVTLGNIVGGAGLVGGIYWAIYSRFPHEPHYRKEVH